VCPDPGKVHFKFSGILILCVHYYLEDTLTSLVLPVIVSEGTEADEQDDEEEGGVSPLELLQFGICEAVT
jgi:hypothetical protein